MRCPIGRVAAFAILVLLALIFFAPLVAHPGAVLYSDHSDFLSLTLPAIRYHVQSYRATGELPKWCPYSFGGHHGFASVPSPALAPFMQTGFLPESAFGPLLCWMVVLHMLIAGWGAYWYGRRRGLTEVGSLVAACGFMFGGAWLLHTLDGGHVFLGVAWLPFVLLFLERAVRERSLTMATLSALFYALLVWGLHPQIAFYAGVLIAPWVVGTALEEAGYLGGEGPASPTRAIRSLALCGILGLWTACLGLALTGMYLLPMLASAEGSTRAAGVSAGDLLLLGRITLFNLVGPSVQQQPRWEETGGFGLIILFLAVAAPLLSQEKRVCYQAGVCVLLILFGLGGALLLQPLPGFNLFRQPARMFVVVGFPVAFLAGVAVDALIAKPGPAVETRGLSRFLLIALTIVVGALVWTWCVLSHKDGRALMIRPYWFSLAITLPATVWLLGGPELPKRWASSAWFALVLIDLWALVWPQVQTRYEPDVFPISPSVAYLAEHRDERGRVLDVDQRPNRGTSIADEDDESPTYRTQCSPLGRGEPLALVLGIETVRGYSPIDIARYKMFLQFLRDRDRPLVALRDHLAFPIVCNVAVKNESLLDLLGTRYLLMPADMVPPAGWRHVLDDPAPTAFDVTTGGMRSLDPYVLYENPNALPRVFIAGSAEALDEDHTLDQLKRTDFRRTALLEGTVPSLPPTSATAPLREASIARYTANEVVVHCEAGEPGILVFTDPWHPAWSCTVNGRAADALRADYVFRGVVLPTEACDVVFRFAPTSYVRGVYLSVAALALVGVVLLVAMVRRWRHAEPEA